MRQVLPLAGAVVGSAFGAPQLGFAIGSIIGNIVDPIEMQGRKLGDAPSQVAAEGGARAIVFGKGCIRATVILERGGRRVVKQRDKSGGKGSGPTTVNERAFWTYAIGIGEAIPDGGLLRIWENEKLVYDVTPDSQIVADSTEFAKLFRFYDGAEDQLPDPAIEAIYTDPTDAPYYRGTAYMVFPQRDLTDFGEAVPTYRVEVAAVTEQTGGYRVFASPVSGDGGLGNLLASVDGVSFVGVVDPGISGNISRIHSAGGRVYVFNGVAQGRVLDPSTQEWEDVTGIPSGGGQVNDIANSNGVTLMVCQNGGVARSLNGADFTPVSAPAMSMYCVDAKGSKFLIGGTNRAIVVSNDAGLTFSTHYLPLDPGGGGPFPGTLGVRSVRSISGGWIAATATSDGIAFSTTGESGTWSFNPSTLSGSGNVVLGVRGSELIAASATSSAHSTNGTAWTASTDSVHIQPQPKLQSNVLGFFAGAGSASVPMVHRSTDGDTWLGSTDSNLSVRVAAIDYSGHTETGDPVPLSIVVSALHNRCGHEATDYDVTALSDMIDGVVIESTQTGAEAINSLIGTHWADPADYDGKIRYIKRGAPVVRTLTIDDLIDEPETWQRNNAIEYPAKMHFFGQIADLAYASVKATSARYSADVKVVGEVSVSSPETFNDSTRPYEVAAILHKILWAEANGEVTWRVTDEHIDLVPTDCVGLSWAGQLWRARITQIETDPGELKLKMKLDRQSAYTANLAAIPAPPAVTPPQTSIVSDTVLAVLDIPALVDAADDLHIVTAMSGETDAWAGAALQRSLDSGATFGTVSSSTLNAIMGTLQVTVTAASTYYTDTTNAVEVELFTDDDIESISEQAFLSEGGAFALSWDDGGTQRWELMQYRDADMIAPKTYRLTTLHRGQLNTESAAHPAGAMFVLLDAAIQRQATQSAWIGTDLTHRAVSNGQTPDGADEQTLTYAGNSQLEFPVAHLILSRTGDDVTATAVPRHRFGTDDAPLRSLNWDGFRWTATDGTNTVTRDGTAETETFDCTGWSSPVSVTVAQLNRITGAGPSVSEGIA